WPVLNADGEGFGTGVVEVSAGAPAFEASLEEREQAGIPVADDEEDEERDGEVVLVGDGVPDTEGEVAADDQFEKRDETEPLAILRSALGFFAAFLDAVFGGAFESALDAEERFHDGDGVGDGEADAEGHKKRQIEEGAIPAPRVEFFLGDEIEGRDGEGGGEEEREVDEEHLPPALI